MADQVGIGLGLRRAPDRRSTYVSRRTELTDTPTRIALDSPGRMSITITNAGPSTVVVSSSAAEASAGIGLFVFTGTQPVEVPGTSDIWAAARADGLLFADANNTINVNETDSLAAVAARATITVSLQQRTL